MEQIFLPTAIEFLDTDRPHVGQLIISPCHQGYWTTLGNALRRVLLSSLPGAAVESAKIAGVQHEFATIAGVGEDVIELLLNVKQIAVRSFSDQPVTLHLSKKGKGPVTAADFEKNADVEVVNGGLTIATITDDKKVFEMDVTIGKGRGYVPVSEKETKHLDLGTIAIDSLFTPIRDVGYTVEMTRVGDVTDYEKLILTIETNGTVTPREAVSQATKILMDHFALILDSTGGEAETIRTAESPEATPEEAMESEAGTREEKKPRKKKKAD